jgi:hypothetical protein
MGSIVRRTPIPFKGRPDEKTVRDGWEIVLRYEGEGTGPALIDLSHCPKWDIQDRALTRRRPWGMGVPKEPGACRLHDGILINRMNPVQASVWHLTGEMPKEPTGEGYTVVTDALALLALGGREVFSIMERATPLDLSSPEKPPPFLVQGPVRHVACQIVVLTNRPEHQVILIACARGYGRGLAEALLSAGEDIGLSPAGESLFKTWLEEVGA